MVNFRTPRRSLSPKDDFGVVSGPMRSGESSLTSCVEDMVPILFKREFKCFQVVQ